LLERCPPSAEELINPRSNEAKHFTLELSSLMAARNAYLRGLVADAEGREADAIDLYVESARISPLFSTGYAQCLSAAVRYSKSRPEEARRLLERLVEAQPSRPVAAELLKRLFR
jgi:hypothetical protein